MVKIINHQNDTVCKLVKHLHFQCSLCGFEFRPCYKLSWYANGKSAFTFNEVPKGVAGSSPVHDTKVRFDKRLKSPTSQVGYHGFESHT